RASLVPVVNLVSYAGYFAMIISIFMGAMQYLMVGILMELATVVFQLVTLPVEFDASKRALKEIEELNLVSKEELDGAKKVLSAAAFTYVASALAAILQLLRLLIMYGNRNND
ncbi:MAG: zinc metallopeptidase, partial [Bacilli bacterium]|nr:zinc metallopeptidase [Bacilli bacterium]